MALSPSRCLVTIILTTLVTYAFFEPKPTVVSTMTQELRPVRLPLSFVFENEGKFAIVAKEIQKPGVLHDVAEHPIAMWKCIICNKSDNLQCKCKEALYCSKECQESDAKLHNPLCKQAAEFSIDDEDNLNANRFRVLILHALENKVEFAWATKTETNLEVAHPTLSDFQLSQHLVNAKPEFLNVHIRGFKLARFLGHGVLLWTLCDWGPMSSKWINKTAVSLGGPPGHTIPLYGPLVLTVFRQDRFDIQKRTLDHVQMRTLRQFVDYIQMEGDNPAVPNPDRFIAWESKEPNVIHGVKINHPFEMNAMGSFGMEDPKEPVCLTRSCPTDRLQWPAAIPFGLGLKWIVREAELPFLLDRKQPTFDATLMDLSRFQWEVYNHKTLGPVVDYAILKRSTFVVCQAGGAPLQVDHIQGLLDYVKSKSRDSKGGQTIKLSGQEFKAFWKEKYSFDGAPPSPYKLELSHRHSIIPPSSYELELHRHSIISDDGYDYDKLMTLVMSKKKSMEQAIGNAEVEAWGVLSTLNEMYPNDDQAVQRVFEYLGVFQKGLNVVGKLADDDGTALTASREIINNLTRSQLRWITRYLETEGLQECLRYLRKGEKNSEGVANGSLDDSSHGDDSHDRDGGEERTNSEEDDVLQWRPRAMGRRLLHENNEDDGDAEDDAGPGNDEADENGEAPGAGQ